MLQIDTASFMLTTENWIPVEGIHEIDLIKALTEEGRRFVKPLRYDAKSASHFANVLLLDAGNAPVALHLVNPYAPANERGIKEKAIRRDSEQGWVWRGEEALMPPLPGICPGRSGAAARAPDGRHANVRKTPEHLG